MDTVFSPLKARTRYGHSDTTFHLTSHISLTRCLNDANAIGKH